MSVGEANKGIGRTTHGMKDESKALKYCQPAQAGKSKRIPF